MSSPQRTSGGTAEHAHGQRFDLLVDQVVDYAIFLLDVEGRVATWNAGAERIKGFTAQEIIGQPYATFFTPEDRQRGKPAEILAAAHSHGRVQDDGWRQRKDGSRFWASAVVTALHDQTGALTGYAKITRDLTDRIREEENARRLAAEEAARRQAELHEQETRRSRDQLDLILRSISEGVTVQRRDGRLAFANLAAARLTGFQSEAELLSAPPGFMLERFHMLDEEGQPLPMEQLPSRRAFQGQPARAIVRLRHKTTGEERWLLISAAPVANPEGADDLVVIVFREVTETKRIEQSWQLLARASSILGSSLEYSVTLAHIVRLALPQMADGCTVELVGPSGKLEMIETAHVDPEKASAFREWRRRPGSGPGAVTERVLATGTPQLLPEITEQMIDAASPDPEYRSFMKRMAVRSGMVVPLFAGHQPFGVISFVMAESGRRYTPHDLSTAVELARRATLAIENARAYREAQSAIQMRDTFLSIASHELRTPLASLSIIMTSLVRMAGQGRLLQLGERALQDRLAKADRQSQQLADLVDRLLDVTRMSSGAMTLEIGEVDLVELAQEVASRFEDSAEHAGSMIELRITEPVAVAGDRARLDQVLTNLVANALKYAPGTIVVISVGKTDVGEAQLIVADAGPGIPREHHERIFRQFERARSDSVPGLGLGLWIVRRIVEAHGGRISVDSSEGRGAHFIVVLPAAARVEEAS